MSAAIAIGDSRVEFWTSLVKQRPELCKLLAPRLNSFIPHVPTKKQTAFLLLPCIEGFYGGAAGGGKSDALLIAGAQYVDCSGYNALILRRTYKDLALPDAIMDRAHQWWRGSGALWVPSKYQWQFPTPGEPATITFGYLQHESDVWQYDSAAFHFIGWDELTQFTEFQYRFMFARLRRKKGDLLPLRSRAASNPGGVGHLWTKKRFVQAPSADRVFIPARLEDNDYIDQVAYLSSLAQLDPVMFQQRRWGDWDAEYEGSMFKRQWFCKFLEAMPVPAEVVAKVRYWDFAATINGGDWTVGSKMLRDTSDRFILQNVRRGQWGPADVERIVMQTAELDGKETAIRIEQEPGSSGKTVVESFVRKLAGYDVKGIPSSGEKVVRWRPFAAQCEAGNVYLYSDGSWNNEWIDEMCAVPVSDHDDQADSASGAFTYLTSLKKTYYGISRIGSPKSKLPKVERPSEPVEAAFGS